MLNIDNFLNTSLYFSDIGPGHSQTCCFCNMSFARQVTMREHFRKKHDVILHLPVTINNGECKRVRKKRKVIDSCNIDLDPADIVSHPPVGSLSSLLPVYSASASGTVNNDALMHEKAAQQEIISPSNPTGESIEQSERMIASFMVDRQFMSDPTQGDKTMNLQNKDEMPVTETSTISAANIYLTLETARNDSLELSNQPSDTETSTVSNSNATKSVVSSESSSLIKTLPLSKTGQQEMPDFHFFLVTTNKKGKSFVYAKQVFYCFHCDYKTHWSSTLCRHMRDRHRHTITLHENLVISSTKVSDNQMLMKMSEYLKLHDHPHFRVKQKIGMAAPDANGAYPCPHCEKSFSMVKYLKKHIPIHRTEKKYLCDECGKSFKTRTYLSTHRRCHKKQDFQCQQCEFASSSNPAIHAHRQIHNASSVLCDVCGFAYIDKSTLKKHMQVHDPTRPYSCTFPGCTWRFKSQQMCAAHVLAHTTEGKFKCSKCGYVFRHKHHLQRHEIKVHKMPKALLKNQQTEVVITSSPDTVNIIVDPELQSALNQRHIVVATDSDGKLINYDVSDISTMNVVESIADGYISFNVIGQSVVPS